MDETTSAAFLQADEEYPHLRAYEPLDQNLQEIRLLHFIPGPESSDSMQLGMKNASLSWVDNRYYALSYCWGDASHMRPIKIGDETVQIRQGVYDFLCQLRRMVGQQGSAAPAFWLDIICINQVDTLERNSQVAMMSSIFGGAKAVYAYLGPETESCKPLSQYMSRNQHGNVNPFATPQGLRVSVPKWLTGLEDVTLRPYFTRLWIIQEAVFARQLWLIFGSQCMAWASFMDAQRAAPESVNRLSVQSGINARLRAIDWLRSKVASDRMDLESLMTLLDWFLECKCRDPRDAVYALLAMSSDHEDFKIDYGQAPQFLWWDVFRHCFDPSRRSIGIYDQPSRLVLMQKLRQKMRTDVMLRKHLHPEGTAEVAVFSMAQIQARTAICNSADCFMKRRSSSSRQRTSSSAEPIDDFCPCWDEGAMNQKRPTDTWRLYSIDTNITMSFPWQDGKIFSRQRDRFNVVSNCEIASKQHLISIEPDQPMRFVVEAIPRASQQSGPSAFNIVGQAWVIDASVNLRSFDSYNATSSSSSSSVSSRALHSWLRRRPYRKNTCRLHGLDSWAAWDELRLLSQQDQRYELGLKQVSVEIDFDMANGLADDRPSTVWTNPNIWVPSFVEPLPPPPSLVHHHHSNRSVTMLDRVYSS